ncbi:MAG: DUF4435 domain-containing protein [Pirellulales bacterium]|nr:DUF4435 domain-containing protein [Pirellulales bacterium]
MKAKAATAAIPMTAVHAAAISSKIASYHEFLARFSKTRKVVYGFVEGREDPAFYRGFIEQLLPSCWEVELWPAGNKDSVLRIHKDIDWRRFQKARICFFVDRDLSDLTRERTPSDRNIYVTEGYSIEIDVVNRATARRVLTELCGFASTIHSDVDTLCDLFEQQFNTFLDSLVSVMAWILAWRRKGVRANLSDIRMQDLFEIQGGILRENRMPRGKRDVVQYIHEQCKVPHDCSIDTHPFETELRNANAYKRLTRGKYVLWFLVEFCNAANRDAVSLCASLTSRPRMNVTFSQKNGMAIIGPRARIPDGLRRFVESTYCAYIAKQK